MAAATHVVLLRGINVGGHNRVAMAALRDALSRRGLDDVRTYVQSGNVVCAAPDLDDLGVAGVVREVLTAELGVTAAVAVVTAARFASIARANPFAVQGEMAPTTVHVGFLAAAPPGHVPEPIEDVARFAPEQLEVGPDAFYLHLPNGSARSPLGAEVARRYAELQPTLRNWRTVQALLGLLGQGGEVTGSVGGP